ncbi:MAG: DUF763 domain-containing protein [Bacteroidales bacterium]
MITRSGQADLPLHSGKVPPWLYERMTKMARAIVEAVVADHGKSSFLSKISDPYWFQALGSVLGMDWHSSGITTSVMGALKQAINPISGELGLFVCGGRGSYSRRTPDELLNYSGKTGLDGKALVRASRLTAKIDNTAIQDGFQIYLHSFIISDTGEWSVVQQGMNGPVGMARRYHWHSTGVRSFVEEPHTSIVGENMGKILNLTDTNADATRQGILDITRESPVKMIDEIRLMVLPSHHDVTYRDVDLKRLGAVLAIAYDRKFKDFEDLLLLDGLGPKTLRSLTLVSEVIYGTPSSFNDPARFSFANGGKDGKPFPVQTSVYDETFQYLRQAIDKAKLGIYDRQRAIKGLVPLVDRLEQNFIPNMEHFSKFIDKEIKESPDHGGKTTAGNLNGRKTKKRTEPRDKQLSLFS